jgi:hypothetical protein
MGMDATPSSSSLSAAEALLDPAVGRRPLDVLDVREGREKRGERDRVFCRGRDRIIVNVYTFGSIGV